MTLIFIGGICTVISLTCHIAMFICNLFMRVRQGNSGKGQGNSKEPDKITLLSQIIAIVSGIVYVILLLILTFFIEK